MAGVSSTSRSPSHESTSTSVSPKRSLSENECFFFSAKRLKEEEEPSTSKMDEVESPKIDVDLLLNLVGRLPYDVHQRIWHYYVSVFL